MDIYIISVLHYISIAFYVTGNFCLVTNLTTNKATFFVKSILFHLFHSSLVWKLRKFTVTQCRKTRNSLSLLENFFRQINYLVISLVKPLLSRNFCEKSVRENFCNFHTVVLQLVVDWSDGTKPAGARGRKNNK